MQEALKNPYYKKIWEEVNWKVRHPDAKSLYSALMVEMEEPSAYGVVMRRASRDYGMSIMFRDMYKIDKCNTTQRPKIIGRPITLEEILILLGKIFNETLNAFKFVLLTCEGAFVTMKPIEHPLHRIEVILGEPFHKQTPETWEKIANLID